LSLRQSVKLSSVLAILAFYSGHSWADTWQQDGSARIATEYDSNPTMGSQSIRVGIWRAFFEPSYKLKQLAGANELNAGIALKVERSSDKTLSQNREDPSAFVDWLRRNDTGEFGISAKYDETATRYTPIDNIATAFADSTRASSTVSGHWSKGVSEYSTLLADGAYEAVFYKGGPFINYTNQSAGLKFSQALSERNTLFMRVSNVSYVPTGGSVPTGVSTSSQVANTTVGWEWKTAEYLGGSLQMGRLRSSAIGYGTQGVADVTYKGQRSELLFSAGRQISPSGLGGFVTNDLVNGNWNYAMSELSKIGIDLVWQKSHLTTDIINSTTSAWLQNELNSFWILRTNFLHRNIMQSGVGSVYTNVVGLTLTYTHADF